MPTLTDMPTRVMADRRWRAALIVLCAAFGHDEEVWRYVQPGVSIDLPGLMALPGRTNGQRTALAAAAAFVCDDHREPVDLVALSDLPDLVLQSVLDAMGVWRQRPLPLLDEPIRDRQPKVRHSIYSKRRLTGRAS